MFIRCTLVFIYIEVIKVPKAFKSKDGDRYGVHRTVFNKARSKILKTQEVCGICGHPVDKTLKYPHPMSATVDHIIPLDKGGHPTDINNLQLAHFRCNRLKSNKIIDSKSLQSNVVGNRILPLTYDWMNYKSTDK